MDNVTFARMALTELRAIRPDWSSRIAEGVQLAVTPPDGQTVTFNLEAAAYEATLGPPENVLAVIRHYLHGFLSGIEDGLPGWDQAAENLVILVIPEWEFEALAGDKPLHIPLSTPVLRAVAAINGPETMTLVTQHLIERWQVPEQEVLSRCMSNMHEKVVPDVEVGIPDSGHPFVLTIYCENYKDLAPSVATFPCVLSRFHQMLGPRLFVAMPARGMCYICGPMDAGILGRFAADMHDKSPLRFLRFMLVVENGKFVGVASVPDSGTVDLPGSAEVM